MPNEGDLKAKWRRHAEKHGFFTQAMSPHQIRGLPDLRVVDLASPELMRSLVRTHEHRIEAKVARLGPRTDYVFMARRDASSHQTLWCLNDRTLGLSSWWLVLSDDHWMLIPGDQLFLSREDWDKGRHEYGDALVELEEPAGNEDPPRKTLIKAQMLEIRENRRRVADLQEGRGGE